MRKTRYFPAGKYPVYKHFNDLGTEAEYTYDYGDEWIHKVKLEGYIYREKGVKYPVCTDGARACPPEDCGGPSGYLNFLNIMANPRHPEYKEYRIWAGEKAETEKFNPESVRFTNPYKRWKGAFLEN